MWYLCGCYVVAMYYEMGEMGGDGLRWVEKGLILVEMG